MKEVILKKNDNSLDYVYRIVNEHTRHAHCWGYGMKQRFFELSMSEQIGQLVYKFN